MIAAPEELEAFQARIDAERLAAGQDQWERMHRLNRVIAGGIRATAADVHTIATNLESATLAHAVESLLALAAELEAGPILSPHAMKQQRDLAALLGSPTPPARQ